MKKDKDEITVVFTRIDANGRKHITVGKYSLIYRIVKSVFW